LIMKQKFRPFHFSLEVAVFLTTSHEFLHAWAVTSVLRIREHCICACSACALSTVLDYSAVSCGMVKRQSIWGTRFPFLAHKMFDINIGWWWRWNHCLLNLDPYLVYTEYDTGMLSYCIVFVLVQIIQILIVVEQTCHNICATCTFFHLFLYEYLCVNWLCD
jgi:hypothetical protein